MRPVLPYRLENVNEGTAKDLELTHLDKTGALQAPATLKYRIDDLTNGREILDWTIVPTPASKNTIQITAAQNQLQTRNNKVEQRQVAVKTIASTGEETQQNFIYDLIRS